MYELLSIEKRARTDALRHLDLEKIILQRSFTEHLYNVIHNYPRKAAIICFQENNQVLSLSYAELFENIKRYLAFFNKKQIKKGDFVGVYLNSSIDLFTVMLALWCLGAVYVPLSVNLEKEKLSYRLQDSGISIVLTNQNFEIGLEEYRYLTIVLIDDVHSLVPIDVTIERMSRDPDDIAYLIYTSGTTNQSKGILIRHEALLSRWYSHWRLLRLTTEDRIGNFFDIHTDPSIMEALLAFASGASLGVTDLNRVEYIARLPEVYKALAITATIFPPTFLANQLEVMTPWEQHLCKYFSALRYIISSTESVTAVTLEKWKEGLNGLSKRMITNGYGSTETTIGCMISEYQPDTEVSLGNPGDAFCGNKVYLLVDNVLYEHYEGEGELCIAGIGLGRYWQNGRINEELTHKSYLFLPDHRGKQIFVYKSGDKVRMRQGVFYFVSRIDRQLKVSGNRLEPEYLENCLLTHENIHFAHILKYRNRLIAIIFLRDLDRIPSYLSLCQLLTEGMTWRGADIPARFYIANASEVEALKLDQFTPDQDRFITPLLSPEDRPDPHFPEAVMLHKIWNDLFGYEVGIHSNFFELGGYSLLLIQMLELIDITFNIHFPYNLLPEALTIEEISKIIVLVKLYSKQYLKLIEAQNAYGNLICFPPISGYAKKEFQLFCRQFGELNGYLLVSPLVETYDDENLEDIKQSYVNFVLHSQTLQQVAKVIAFSIIHYFGMVKLFLCGWSFGGLLAFEVAKHLQRFAASQYQWLGILDSQSIVSLTSLSLIEHYERTQRIMFAIAQACGVDNLKIRAYTLLFSGRETFQEHIENIYKRIVNNIKDDERYKKTNKLILATRVNFLLTASHSKNNNKLLKNTTLFVAGKTGELGRECVSGSWDVLVDKDSFEEVILEDADHQTILYHEKVSTYITAKVRALQQKGAANFFRAANYDNFCWQLPLLSQHYVNRRDIEEELSRLTPMLSVEPTKLTVIKGMSGSGKTVLANFLIHHLKGFSFKIWFNADNESNLQLQYVQLGILLGLCGTSTSFEDVKDVILAFFAQQMKAVYVYDNAESLDKLKPYLPVNSAQVIITTITSNWPKPNIVNLDVMKIGEAIDLVRKITASSEADEVIEALVTDLGCLPLAVAQASAFSNSAEVSIKDYLRQYQDVILKDNAILPAGDQHLPVIKTFELSISAINKINPLAIIFLTIFAYLDAVVIPEETLFKCLTSTDKQITLESFIELKKILLNFSLIKFDLATKTYQIHSLVQLIIRQTIAEEMRLSVINSIYQYLLVLLSQRDESMAHYLMKKSLLAHTLKFLETTVDYLSGDKRILLLLNLGILYFDSAEIYQTIEVLEQCEQMKNSGAVLSPENVAILQRYLGRAYGSINNHVKQKNYLEQSIVALNQCYGDEHPLVAETMSYLSAAYGGIEEYQQQMQMLENAIVMMRKFCDDHDIRMLKLMKRQANAYAQLQRPEKQKELLEFILPHFIKYYGQDHSEVADVLNCLGYAYGSCDPDKFSGVNLLEEKLKLIKRALQIYENIYGPFSLATALVKMNLGYTYGELGYYVKMKTTSFEAAESIKQFCGNRHPVYARALLYLANAYGFEGNFDKKRQLLNEVIDIIEESNGPDMIYTLALSHLREIDDPDDKQLRRRKLERFLVFRRNKFGESDERTLEIVALLEKINKKKQCCICL